MSYDNALYKSILHYITFNLISGYHYEKLLLPNLNQQPIITTIAKWHYTLQSHVHVYIGHLDYMMQLQCYSHKQLFIIQLSMFYSDSTCRINVIN